MFVRSLSDVPRNAVRPLDPEEALFADWTPMIVVHLVRRTCVSAFDANLQSETRFSSSGQTANLRLCAQHIRKKRLACVCFHVTYYRLNQAHAVSSFGS